MFVLGASAGASRPKLHRAVESSTVEHRYKKGGIAFEMSWITLRKPFTSSFAKEYNASVSKWAMSADGFIIPDNPTCSV
jgi:hypothetical protein